MKGFKRFLCFLIPFAIVCPIAWFIHPILGSAVTGIGFTIAYCDGEK